MREKLLDLMKSEGLKSSQLADMLGINPAGISHMLAGRNKPGFDLLQKILRRFPRISPDWLLLDSGPMYRDAEESAPASYEKPETSQATADRPAQLGGSTASPKTIATPENPQPPKPEIPKPGNRTAEVRRIVIFYEDGAFESYFPTMR